MVSWQVFVELAFDVANGKGAQFSGIEDGAGFIEDLSEVWQQDKQRYKQMTKKQARNALKDLVEA